jgi:hypothetical protein
MRLLQWKPAKPPLQCQVCGAAKTGKDKPTLNQSHCLLHPTTFAGC